MGAAAGEAEFDACAEAAERAGISVRDMIAFAVHAAEHQLFDEDDDEHEHESDADVPEHDTLDERDQSPKSR